MPTKGDPRRRLLLLRHAKSSWGDPGLPDHDRPLAPRGERAIVALRGHLAASGIVPGLVLCSTARRARQTWEGVAAAFPAGVAVEVTGDLYEATAADILRLVRRTPDTVDAVLVVGHNPGLEDLAGRLAGSGDGTLRERLDEKFPAGALATLDVPAPWSELWWGAAALSGYVVPRELPGGD